MAPSWLKRMLPGFTPAASWDRGPGIRESWTSRGLSCRTSSCSAHAQDLSDGHLDSKVETNAERMNVSSTNSGVC